MDSLDIIAQEIRKLTRHDEIEIVRDQLAHQMKKIKKMERIEKIRQQVTAQGYCLDTERFDIDELCRFALDINVEVSILDGKRNVEWADPQSTWLEDFICVLPSIDYKDIEIDWRDIRYERPEIIETIIYLYFAPSKSWPTSHFHTIHSNGSIDCWGDPEDLADLKNDKDAPRKYFVIPPDMDNRTYKYCYMKEENNSQTTEDVP